LPLRSLRNLLLFKRRLKKIGTWKQNTHPESVALPGIFLNAVIFSPAPFSTMWYRKSSFSLEAPFCPQKGMIKD